MLLESKSILERPIYGSLIVKTSREMEKASRGYREVLVFYYDKRLPSQTPPLPMKIIFPLQNLARLISKYLNIIKDLHKGPLSSGDPEQYGIYRASKEGTPIVDLMLAGMDKKGLQGDLGDEALVIQPLECLYLAKESHPTEEDLPRDNRA